MWFGLGRSKAMFARLFRLLITTSVVCAGAAGAATASAGTQDAATGGWDRPEVVAPTAVDDVQVAPNGEMTLVVPRSDDVALRQRPPGGDWGTLTPVPGTDYADNVRAAYDGASQLTLAWLEQRGSARVLTAHQLSGGGWSTPEVVAQRSDGRFADLQLVANQQGDAAVGWVWHRNGMASRLLVSQGSAGSWGPVEQLGKVAMFELALGDSGLAAVVKNHFEGQEPNVTEIVHVVRQLPSGAWGAGKVLVRVPDVTFFIGLGSVAVDGGGTTTVAWRAESPTGDWQLRVARARAGHAWGATVTLDPHAGAVYESPPVVKAAADGSVAAFWIHQERALRVARHPAGGDWTHPVVVTQEIGTYVWDAALDPSGRAVAVWAEGGWFGEPGVGLRARLMNRQGVWGALANITLPKARLYDPVVAMNHGDALAVWAHVIDRDSLQARASIHLAGAR